MNAKTKLLDFLSKADGQNTFSAAQASNMFKLSPKTVKNTVYELRGEGYPIYLNTRLRGDGTKVGVYRLGTPSKSFRAACRANGVRAKAV